MYEIHCKVARQQHRRVHELGQTLMGEPRWVPKRALRAAREPQERCEAEVADNADENLLKGPLDTRWSRDGFYVRSVHRRKRQRVVDVVVLLPLEYIWLMRAGTRKGKEKGQERLAWLERPGGGVLTGLGGSGTHPEPRFRRPHLRPAHQNSLCAPSIRHDPRRRRVQANEPLHVPATPSPQREGFAKNMASQNAT
jgi:hypothetical protein